MLDITFCCGGWGPGPMGLTLGTSLKFNVQYKGSREVREHTITSMLIIQENAEVMSKTGDDLA